MSRLLIIGAGGHGRAVAEAVLMGGIHEVAGFADDGWPGLGEVWGHPVLAVTADLAACRAKADAAIVAIGNNAARAVRCSGGARGCRQDRRWATGCALVTASCSNPVRREGAAKKLRPDHPESHAEKSCNGRSHWHVVEVCIELARRQFIATGRRAPSSAEREIWPRGLSMATAWAAILSTYNVHCAF